MNSRRYNDVYNSDQIILSNAVKDRLTALVVLVPFCFLSAFKNLQKYFAVEYVKISACECASRHLQDQINAVVTPRVSPYLYSSSNQIKHPTTFPYTKDRHSTRYHCRWIYASNLPFLWVPDPVGLHLRISSPVVFNVLHL